MPIMWGNLYTSAELLKSIRIATSLEWADARMVLEIWARGTCTARISDYPKLSARQPLRGRPMRDDVVDQRGDQGKTRHGISGR
jgi:hypothetical protein